MSGTRFLSAFLKVNPYFTVVLAVSFSGVAAVGFKDSDTAKSLKKLIPLHLESILASHPAGKVVADVAGAQQARDIIRNASYLPSSGLTSGVGNFANVLRSEPPETQKTGRWRDLGLATINEPFEYRFVGNPLNPTGQDLGQPLIQADPPTKEAAQLPPDPQIPPQQGNLFGPVIPGFTQAGQAPVSPAPSIVANPPVTSPVIVQPDIVISGGGSPDVPPDILPAPLPNFSPGPLPDQGPGIGTVDVAEPPMAIAFAAFLPLLLRLRRRAPIRVAL